MQSGYSSFIYNKHKCFLAEINESIKGLFALQAIWKAGEECCWGVLGVILQHEDNSLQWKSGNI